MLIRILILLSLYCFSAYASADDLLKRYLPETCYQSGEFEQQKPLGKTAKLLTSQGRFAFACDKGLVWHTQSPLIETNLYQLNGRQWLKSGDNPMQQLTGKIHRHLGNILNQLIGGNQQYLNKHFEMLEQDQTLVLTPKQSRMKKFLQQIQIIPAADSVTIKMQHPDNYTQVRIFNINSRESLNQTECRDSTQTSDEICHRLFES
jgi:hypothetical protein